jgi:type II secretory pathway predicted ATPase ExeA/cell division septation protein DedD
MSVSLNYVKRTTSLVEAGVNARGGAPFHPPQDTLTYEPYFGLTEKAFSLNADPRFVYDSPGHVATREGLLAGIRRREGLLVLTGQIGTGKTTLCRTVLTDLGRHTYSSLVPDPFASREDLLKMLLIDFGVLSIPELTAGPLRQASRTELSYLLAEFLDSLTHDAFAVVMIDEAQNLSLPLIEETRLLSDTFGARGRLQIVFVGQPELHAKLKTPEMRQVDQRVCGYHRLEPMSRDAVAGYIEHRWRVAGRNHDGVLFAPEIVDALHLRSGGVPRLINRVCDRALQLAFERREESVNREVLDTVLIEVGSATLSPTWDSIMFAEPAKPVSSAAQPAIATAAPETPVALSAPKTIRAEASTDDENNFKEQVEHWVAQELAAPSRTLTPRQAPRGDTTPWTPAAERRRSARPSTERHATTRTVNTDWPRDLRSETYMHRLLRKWAKGAAIAAAVVAALNLIMVAASLVPSLLSSAELPALPAAPARTVPALVALDLSPAYVPVASGAHAAPGDFLVAVGVFTSRERADQIAESLTQAGLPIMQRTIELRGQQVQQIVLGPFFSRSDATTDLRRLQQLGGYDDARVIDGIPAQ